MPMELKHFSYCWFEGDSFFPIVRDNSITISADHEEDWAKVGAEFVADLQAEYKIPFNMFSDNWGIIVTRAWIH